jgi:hypothetical protein
MGLCLGPQNWVNEAPGPLLSGEISVDRVFGLFVKVILRGRVSVPSGDLLS